MTRSASDTLLRCPATGLTRWTCRGAGPAHRSPIGAPHNPPTAATRWLSDAVPKPSRLPIVLSAEDEPPARVIAVRLPRDDAAALREALGEIYSLAVKYDTVVYEPARAAIHLPNREMGEYASATFWPRQAIRIVVAIVIGVAVAVVAWQLGIPLVSGVVALFALFMIGSSSSRWSRRGGRRSGAATARVADSEIEPPRLRLRRTV